jgi:hypothetical protein
MTDTTASRPVQTTFTAIPRPRLPAFGIAEALERMATILSRALTMAYVDPFRPPSRRDDERI